jgi:hypothetical protein
MRDEPQILGRAQAEDVFKFLGSELFQNLPRWDPYIEEITLEGGNVASRRAQIVRRLSSRSERCEIDVTVTRLASLVIFELRSRSATERHSYVRALREEGTVVKCLTMVTRTGSQNYSHYSWP